MFRIRPSLEVTLRCPDCGDACAASHIVWQGMHVVARAHCSACGGEYLSDLPCHQGTLTPLVLDTKDERLWEARWTESTVHSNDMAPASKSDFFSGSLLNIHRGGEQCEVPFKVERFRSVRKVVLLNTVDFIYGHSMPCLLDAARFRNLSPELGLAVIIQPFLRWMVPSWVAEVWTVELPLTEGRKYFPKLSARIDAELGRFDEVYLSHAYTLPRQPVDIEWFTGVARHDVSTNADKISFIWREDPRRYWCSTNYFVRAAKRLLGTNPIVHCQRLRVTRLFELIRRRNPRVTFAVAGLGRTGRFPSWIGDHRVDAFTEQSERDLCRLYASSRVVIGVLGSHMLLPSMLAGSVISLMPSGWWGAFGQDLMPNDGSEAMAIFSRRVLPVDTPLPAIAACATHMLQLRDGYWRRMVDPFSPEPRRAAVSRT